MAIPQKPGAKPPAAQPPTTQPPAAAKPPVIEDDADKTIKEIADIKAKMVSREEYDKALSDRDKFKKALLEGATATEDEEILSRAELVAKMAAYKGGNVTNLQYITTALQLRQAAIDETGEDPFECADSPEGFGQKVADGLQGMVDEASGRPEAFLGIYQSSVRDEKIMKPN